METIHAIWQVSLDVDCPGCEEYVDLLDYCDFWYEHSNIEVAEYGTSETENMEVVCPDCGKKFNVTLKF